MSERRKSPYKYSCRRCPVRTRCVEESVNSPIIKASIRNAFKNKTDTLDLWEHLQINCLLVKADKERAKGTTESLLGRRLRMVREANTLDTGALPAGAEGTPAKTDATVKRPPPPKPKPTPQYYNYAPPPSHIVAPEHLKPPKPPRKTDRPPPNAPYWFTVRGSGRHIRLPSDGELILGRFDPNFGLPPDVDLTFEDGTDPTVSRRHAGVQGKNGFHTIQEMGGKYGVTVNGQKVGLGVLHKLKSGDVVRLGRCELRYDVVPQWITHLHPAEAVTHILLVSTTGMKIEIPAGAESIIGRRDRFVNFAPDIDLADLKNISSKVSRRHALLTARSQNNQLYIEDMGSGFGTKVNGEMLLMGDKQQLHPGDHIWLGGCVLAYDIILG